MGDLRGKGGTSTSRFCSRSNGDSRRWHRNEHGVREGSRRRRKRCL